ILREVEGKIGIDGRIGDVGGGSKEERVAVLRRTRDKFGRQARSRSRLVLDHELLAKNLAHALPEHARGNVGRRPRDEADDDADRPRRVLLGVRTGRNKLSGERQCERDSSSPCSIHLLSSRCIRSHRSVRRVCYFLRPAASAAVAQRLLSPARQTAQTSGRPPTRSIPWGASALATSSACKASLAARASLST